MNVSYQAAYEEFTEEPETQQAARSESDNGRIKMMVYETGDAFEALSAQWDDLSERVGGHLYMSSEWTENWWRFFGKNNQRSLFLITMWDLDELVGIAPMYMGYSKIGPIVVERRLQIIGSGGSPNEQFGYLDDYGISDFLDFLVDESYAEEAAALLLDVYFSERYRIDTVTLHQAGDNSFIMKHLYPEITRSGIKYDLQHIDTCPVIDLKSQASLPGYIKQAKSNARRRFRQTIRAIGTEEGFDIEDINSPEEIDSAVDKLITLHQNRWNQIGFPGVFYDDRFTGFFKHLVHTAYSENWLWFKQARDQEGICALRMILKYNGRYYDYISGFNDDCPSSKYRPGIGLLLDLVEEAIDEKATSVELLRGEEGYKYDFTSDNFKNWKVTFSPGSRHKSVANIVAYPLKMAAIMYKYVTRECRLLHIQYNQRGILKMFWGYLNFRITSLRIKLDS